MATSSTALRNKQVRFTPIRFEVVDDSPVAHRACPRCDAPAGYRCRYSSGIRGSYFHRERYGQPENPAVTHPALVAWWNSPEVKKLEQYHVRPANSNYEVPDNAEIIGGGA